MKVAVESTGGLVVLSESFGHSVFKDSFKRVFEDGEQSLGLCSKLVSSLLLCQYFPIISSVSWCSMIRIILATQDLML